MIMHELNPEQEEALLLIHPMLATASMVEAVLPGSFKKRYRLLLPDLSGHGEAAGERFESAHREAEQIHAYLKENGINRLRLGYGASLGGVVLFSLLSYEDITFEKLFFEGASPYHNAPVTGFMLKRYFLSLHKMASDNGAFVAVNSLRSYGDEAATTMAKQVAAMDEASVKNMVHACAHVTLPNLSPVQQKHTVFAYGEKDGNLKKAKRVIPKRYPLATLRVWSGSGHCTRLTADSKEYMKQLREHVNA